MRNSTLFFICTGFSLTLMGVMTLHAHHGQSSGQSERLIRTRMVKEYQLTDLCLFTEARYTRHPSMADRHAPAQDHPGALEHFPSGSLISPPAYLARRHE
jgi:hypothetical protein